MAAAAVRLSQKTSTVEDLAELKRLARVVMDRVAEERDAQVAPPIPAETIWKIRSLFAKLTATGAEDALPAALNWVVAHRQTISNAAVAWIDLLDQLVQASESRYGAEGRGKLKKEEVKTVLSALLRDQRFELPHVPRYLQPVAIDIVADFSIDAIVAVSNTHDLWVEEGSPTISEFYRRLKHAVGAILGPIFEPFERFVTWLYFRLRYPRPLSPALRNALDAVEKSMAVLEKDRPLDQALRLKIWIGENSQSLVALVQLASIIVDQLEKFMEAPGDIKKAYAKQIAVEVLRDLGFDIRSDFFLAVVEAVVDVAIDSAVHMFHKRGHGNFPLRTNAQAAARATGGR
jgi:hypothetical protein